MTTTPRTTPTGPYLEDGYQVLIAPAANPAIQFWEKTVTPPGIVGGDIIDITTQHNADWRTGAPRSLRTLSPITLSVSYNPAVYDNILDILNSNGWWTITFPDGSTLDFVGALTQFTPGALAEGSPPEATITISPTNQINGSEEAPVYTEPPTTP